MQQKTQSNTSELATVRDTVESIWIAIVLAFVLRAFFIEAFVIPTGSMAPRLMGEHWDLQCPNCQYEYAYGYQASAQNEPPPRNRRYMPPSARCPNCNFKFTSASADMRSDYINAGDRVLVMKYLYCFRSPEPWDVVVFKNPQNNQENYIKRLIGLPGETIEIVHGDIFYLPAGTQLPPTLSSANLPWTIRRKPQKAQDAMWQVIFDNDYRPAKEPSPKSWGTSSDSHAWDLTPLNGRQFAFLGKGKGEVNFNAEQKAFQPVYGYNDPDRERFSNADVITDLKLAATFVPHAADSAVTLQLTSFENRFRATVKADGGYTVSYCPSLTKETWQTWSAPAAALPTLEIGKGHDIALVNVDFQVQLWIDGRQVFTSTDAQYKPDYKALKERMADLGENPIPTPEVKIAGEGGKFDLLHVKLMRDVFYTSANLQDTVPLDSGMPISPQAQYAQDLGIGSGISGRVPGWGTMGHPITLSQDSFFVLGDNSPQSLDGRAWGLAAPSLKLWKHPAANHSKDTVEQNKADALYQLGTVPRYNMIGKALFVYWPAGLRPLGMDVPPLVPNVGKMRLIR